MEERKGIVERTNSHEGLPLQFKIYKGIRGKNGAMKLTLKKAYSGTKKDEGCVFLDMAEAVGPNQYDWEHKILISLSLSDISKLILYLTDPYSKVFKDNKLSIYHDRNMGTKEKEGDDVKVFDATFSDERGSFGFQLSHVTKVDGEKNKRSIFIPVSEDEALTIRMLLTASVPLVMAWV
jgi:hypothetical protein